MSSGLPAYIILRAIEDTLKPLIDPHGGKVEVAHDPAQAISLLANAPNGWRVILGIDDEDSAESSPAGMVGVSDTEIYAIIQAGTGLANDAGAQVHRKRSGNSPSVLEIAEAVRGWIRGMQFEHEDIYCGGKTFAWKRSTWASYAEDGKPVAYARQHVFTVRHNVSSPAAVEPSIINYP